MSISATSLPNTIGTGYDVNAADLANPAGGKSLSVLRFEQSLARADAPEAQPVAFFAPDRKSTRLNSSHPSRSRMPSSA